MCHEERADVAFKMRSFSLTVLENTEYNHSMRKIDHYVKRLSAERIFSLEKHAPVYSIPVAPSFFCK